ncbi:MAG: hypothetical protein A3A94_02835 [Candidatus Portnoybacteria bacterium RIFCSPLOWO2_01_FULL_43_11]|uniref:Glycosyltransferase RgtA/B/C/D-like domain-containing protein n=4 Tax=Candidatus Portnoyibacteriota TaxID=1817913 RepID=A0A1G2FA88_9BACT|nr:MAG: hypothetical protein A2815_00910 [Candidatus Portnoybacteria bacterium RIFCSPHIGHO2_01_FULL_40_12b]OGZ36393.1 MAG: hypothetical protein A3D38_00890 [Candidatus Portnoybacteria bacterium RIFCSPHIGHO2_02_FULL_40_23]OGZ38012.1 MAG: hypothetical protein A3E90_02025 [Candidatus Portnoybacteria bacterium RIFCSPHIGHO2_12_FULL_40_11]OGZ38498.1 MAG: hypothetical protein A3A94_02835 [Candidatus Portnoybacteria bacterium RIFCSPLOWO2_01_FULL_43_11]OGZ40047.1 MAG: hypothetical protein A3I20_01510 [C
MKIKNRQTVILIFLILILASFFRLWRIDSVPPGLYSDEAMNGNNALATLETGQFKVFYPENNGREGLFINIIAFSIKIFGNQAWAIRLPSVLFGILTVLGIFFLTKILFQNERVALFTSFFLAASFWHINFSRISFRAIMAPAFLVWSLYLLWRIIKKTERQKLKPETNFMFRSSILAVFSGFIYGLGFHSYIAYRITPLLILAALLAFFFKAPAYLRKKILLPIFLFLIFAFIAFLPLGFYFLENPQDFFGRTSQISIFESSRTILNLFKNTFITSQMFVFLGDFNWRHNYAGAPQLWLPVALLFLLGIFKSFKKLFSKISQFRFENLILLLWFFLLLLPVIVSNEGLPHSLRAILVAPAAMIFAGLGLEEIIKKIPGKKTTVLFIVVFFILIAGQSYNRYFREWAKNPNVSLAFNENLSRVADELNDAPENIPKYIIMKNTEIFDYRGTPMSAQPIMFLTKTFLPQWQKEKNFFYLPQKEAVNLPSGAKIIWIE